MCVTTLRGLQLKEYHLFPEQDSDYKSHVQKKQQAILI